eukprot:CAMPEP_0174878302 /NCGR_PEP_ID=MMETSP1114-20130205/82690_1 /TAXON_ID=312471 /ORGANISM="Neobodo designis, Strain CCAP 1951/1" /LENGTH=552 /DNA_ID=CAMNT_0016113689 /DNA_START=140 /DNA_END=1798 /DNA_ORIENTATION=-
MSGQAPETSATDPNQAYQYHPVGDEITDKDFDAPPPLDAAVIVGDEEEDAGSDEAQLKPLSPLQRGLMIALIMWVLVAIAGPITGPQAIFGALARRGVYRDKCPPANATCMDQEYAIEDSIDRCLAICTFTCVAWGFVQDVIGARKLVVIGIAVWTVAKSCAGFYPENGIAWTVCESIAASASQGTYGALGLEHLRQACGNERTYGVMGFIASAVWDMAVVCNLALALLYGWGAITLWQAYLIYGLGAGVPVLVGLFFWPKKRPEVPLLIDPLTPESRAGEALGLPTPSRHSWRSGSQGRTSAPPALREKNNEEKREEKGVGNDHLGACDSIKNTARAIKAIASTGIFWAFAAHSSLIVTIGNFMIANVGSLAESHKITDRSRARDITTIMMSVIGLSSLVPGRILYAFGTQRGLTILMVIEAILIAGFGALIALGNSLNSTYTFYVGFGIMFAWRVWGFGLAFPFINWRYQNNPSGIGVCFGSVLAVSGAVAMGVSPVAADALHDDPVENVKPVMLGLCGAACVIELVFAGFIARVSEKSLTGEARPLLLD